MSGKLLFYSDTHLREFSSFPPYCQLADNGLTKELNNIISGFEFVADCIRKIKPERVGMLGDLYNNTEFQSARVLYGSHLALSRIKSACDEVGAEHDMISGNHDILSEQHNISSIANLRGYGNIYLEPQYVTMKNGFKVTYLPALSNTGVIFSQLSNAQNQSDLICTHADFAGCKYESGMPSSSPLPAQWPKPIISGDIHLPQDIGSVKYVGSLIQNKFYRNSLKQLGGVLVYNTEDGTYYRIPNNYSKHYMKFFDGIDKDLPAPTACVLQVVSSRSKEEVAETYKDYEHYHVPAMEQKSDVRVNYSHFSLDNPEKLLRVHVNKERPEALEVFDEIITTS
jgi:hypothetical protein